MASAWDLTALVNAADPKAPLVERNLWWVRLAEWLRQPRADTAGIDTDAATTPRPVLRLRHLLKLLDTHADIRDRVRALVAAFWRDADAAALYADFGHGARLSLLGELGRRLRLRVLPGTPDTADLDELFQLLFKPADVVWIAAIDTALFERVAALLAPPAEAPWRAAMLDAVTILVSAVHAGGFAPPLRRRMDASLLADKPFRQLAPAAEAVRVAVLEGTHDEALRAASYLRALLDACGRAAASITAHLEEFGVSPDIVYELDQLQQRNARIELLLDCVLAPEPLPSLQHLTLELLRAAAAQRGLRSLLGQNYSLLARLVAERNAETGEHYITRDRAEYRAMLARAAGGGLVVAVTTFAKFAILALGLAAFWSGLWQGVAYAASFVVILLLHWTLATKQPAMTAPAMAASLAGGADDAHIELLVDRIAQLMRSQVAGIVGNLLACAPLVLLVQLACKAAFGAPPVGAREGAHVLHALTLLGPTLLYAAFTGVLLFASSLVAGWAENWFVFHRLDSAIAHNPRIVERLGAARARRWSHWWRGNVSGLAANVSLGLMLGLLPALAGFFALPVEVRHVTLSTGQLAAAAGAIGWRVTDDPAFWWCVAGIAATGLLNLGVSFWLAFKVALRSRGIELRERRRIGAALRQRLQRAPLSFVLPPRLDA